MLLSHIFLLYESYFFKSELDKFTGNVILKRQMVFLGLIMSGCVFYKTE